MTKLDVGEFHHLFEENVEVPRQAVSTTGGA